MIRQIGEVLDVISQTRTGKLKRIQRWVHIEVCFPNSDEKPPQSGISDAVVDPRWKGMGLEKFSSEKEANVNLKRSLGICETVRCRMRRFSISLRLIDPYHEPLHYSDEIIQTISTCNNAQFNQSIQFYKWGPIPVYLFNIACFPWNVSNPSVVTN